MKNVTAKNTLYDKTFHEEISRHVLWIRVTLQKPSQEANQKVLNVQDLQDDSCFKMVERVVRKDLIELFSQLPTSTK